MKMMIAIPGFNCSILKKLQREGAKPKETEPETAEGSHSLRVGEPLLGANGDWVLVYSIATRCFL